jgi:hypothetical protein
MNKNFLTIAIIALILIGVGMLYFAATKTEQISTNTVSTTTPEVVEVTNTPPPPAQKEAAAPIVTTGDRVTASDTTLIVTGTVNPMGAFANYWFEYGNTQALGSKTTNQTLGSGFNPLKAPGYITNLTKNTTYYFRLVAENQFGRVLGTIYPVNTTVGTPIPVGSAPTTKTLSANNLKRTSADIHGEVNPNKSATQYWFEYGMTTQLGNISVVSFASDGNTKITVSNSLSGLQPFTTYYYRIDTKPIWNNKWIDFKLHNIRASG